MAAAMLLTLAGTIAFNWSNDPAIFVASNICTSITWSFVISYLLGMSAELDRSGRTAAMAGFASKMGLATGPLVGGMLIGAKDYASLINISAAILGLSMLALLWPASLLDRERRSSFNKTDPS